MLLLQNSRKEPLYKRQDSYLREDLPVPHRLSLLPEVLYPKYILCIYSHSHFLLKVIPEIAGIPPKIQYSRKKRLLALILLAIQPFFRFPTVKDGNIA
mgnify:CR=1 FL=1